jgi:hypothetical protein
MKLALTLISAVIALAGCRTDPVEKPVQVEKPAAECRPMAEIEPVDRGRGFVVMFSRSIAEVLNGRTNCDFGFSRISVDRATYDGSELIAGEKQGDPIYASEVPFDPAKGGLNIEFEGASYITDPSTIEKTSKGYRLRMRRFPPK